MRSISLLLALASAVSAQTTLATATRSSAATPTYSEPCAAVSASIAAVATGRKLVSAKLAYDCLNSVPLVDKNGDIELIDELKDYLQWQTTLQYLKNPPSTYQGGPPGGVDIMGGLDAIKTGVSNGTITSEYQLQSAITQLLRYAYEGHLSYTPDILAVFAFNRLNGVISLSSDGIALPELYFYDDIAKLAAGQKFNASTIKQINGKDASQYIEALANTTVNSQDVDQRYNAMFPNQAGLSTGSQSAGGFSGGIYDGPSTNYTVSNSSTPLVITNVAVVRQNFTGVNSGKAFIKAFLSGPATTSTKRRKRSTNKLHDHLAAPSSSTAKLSAITATSSATVRPTVSIVSSDAAAPSATGYPKPIYIQSGLAISGYYLNGTGYDDVAVLAIPDYGPSSPDSEIDPTAEFQEVTRLFLADAVKQKKKKLIIDVRNNGGGKVILGFDTFKQLFPQIVPYGGSRYRAHEAIEVIGAAIADISNNKTLRQIDPEGYDTVLQSLSDFDYHNPLNVNNTNFKSFKDWYGPNKFDNDYYVSQQRYNFSDALSNPGNINVTGYGDESNPPPQPFPAENIVILSDGTCASTCTIFAELMREQAKVTIIAIGGRPINKPMQGVGGTRGSLTLYGGNIQKFANTTLAAVEAAYGQATAEKVNSTVIGRLANPVQLLQRTTYNEDIDSFGVQINAFDNLRQNDTKQIPLQFIDQAADCKIFNTFQGFNDVTNVWKLAADVKWGSKQCVPGSTGDPTAISSQQGGPSFNNKTIKLTQNQQQDQKGAASGLAVSGMAAVAAAAVAALLM